MARTANNLGKGRFKRSATTKQEVIMTDRRYQAEFISGLVSRDKRADCGDYLMFPPHHNATTQSLLDIDPCTASLCDLSRPTGVGLAMLDLDPLATAFFSRLDRNKDE